MTTTDLVAAFLASGRKITQVPSGERRTTDHELRHAVREVGKLRGQTEAEREAKLERDDDERRFNERHVVTDHAGREFVRNGYGEWL